MSMFPTKILLATDGSDNSAPAARAAADLAAKTGSEVHLVYVGEDISSTVSYSEMNSEDEQAARRARELLDEQAERIETDGATVAEKHIIAGDEPEKEVIKLSREPDVGVVVVGSRGLNWLERKIKGSVSSVVVRDAYCPVLVVHADADA